VRADTNSANNHIQRQRGRDPPVQYAAVFTPQPCLRLSLWTEEPNALTQGNALNSVIIERRTTKVEIETTNVFLYGSIVDLPHQGNRLAAIRNIGCLI